MAILGTGSRGIQRDMKCSEREVRRHQNKQGFLPDIVLDQPCTLVYEADFKTINIEKLTLLSKIGHLVRGVSDKVQVIYSQMEKEECAYLAKLGLTRCQVESSFLPSSSHCLFA